MAILNNLEAKGTFLDLVFLFTFACDLIRTEQNTKWKVWESSFNFVLKFLYFVSLHSSYFESLLLTCVNLASSEHFLSLQCRSYWNCVECIHFTLIYFQLHSIAFKLSTFGVLLSEQWVLLQTNSLLHTKFHICFFCKQNDFFCRSRQEELQYNLIN